MKPLHQVLRDLQFTAGQGTLTPSFVDCCARRHGEGVRALYALAARHELPVAAEDGRPAVLRRRGRAHALRTAG